MIPTEITAEQFDRAFAEFKAFGPRARTPIEQRWREVFPNVKPELFTALKVQCKEIEVFAFSLSRDLSKEEALTLVARKYPFLSDKTLAHTWGWIMYLWSYS